MYMVVSKWRPLPGKEDAFIEKGRAMRAMMRSQPGVKMMEGFRSEDGTFCSVHVYDSEESYRRIVHDPNGPFATAAAEHGIESVGEWIGSERGETQD